MYLIKITPDKERARSILKMVNLIEERIKIQDKESMTALIISDYYEIIKELLTALLLIDGYKTLSHKELIEYVERNYKEFTRYEISLMDNLRTLRNRVVYEGLFIEKSYLDRNEDSVKRIIKKLKGLINKKL
ncbi:hypothetical protein J7K74_00800 [Candidatus Woesearchaeota archaeon]|nr:hypothetical protein [Candidatus Woesearchaeota archaeon]